MHVSVYWFGRPAASPYSAEVEVYRKRVTRRWKAHDVPLRPAPSSADGQGRSLMIEAERARQRLPRGSRTVAMDERGELLSSGELAGRLRRWEDAAVPHVVFVVGGDRGLDRNLVEAADETLSLSPLTFPHQLARLIVWEQLYRAVDILSGGRYHRGDVQL